MAGPERELTPVSAVHIEVEVCSVDELYAMYMPFISGGGLFLNDRRPGETPCELGADVTMALRLTAGDEQLLVPGRVVWLTPSSRQQGAAGAGIQFLDNGEAQSRIERLLAGLLGSERPTLTL